MKKMMLVGLTAAVVLGLSRINTTLAQEDMQVSPRVWVLGASGINVVDIHIAVPLAAIDTGSILVEVTSDDEGKEPLSFSNDEIRTFADSRGELVIKFSPEISEEFLGDTLCITVTAEFNDDGGPLEENFCGISVEEATQLMNQVQPARG